MKFIIILILFISNLANAKDRITIDHPFILSIIEDLFPNKFEYQKLYSAIDMHQNMPMKYSNIINIKTSKMIFSISKYNYIKSIVKNVKIINLSDCKILNDEFCNQDKHFWLSPKVTLQIYIIIFNTLKGGDEKEINFAQNIINNIKKIDTSLPCNANKIDVYTDHSFFQRLRSYTKIKDNIFSNFGDIMPSKLQILQNNPSCILSENILGDNILRKIHKDTKISTIDPDGNFFNNIILTKLSHKNNCTTNYCDYIEEIKKSICKCF